MCSSSCHDLHFHVEWNCVTPLDFSNLLSCYWNACWKVFLTPAWSSLISTSPAMTVWLIYPALALIVIGFMVCNQHVVFHNIGLSVAATRRSMRMQHVHATSHKKKQPHAIVRNRRKFEGAAIQSKTGKGGKNTRLLMSIIMKCGWGEEGRGGMEQGRCGYIEMVLVACGCCS